MVHHIFLKFWHYLVDKVVKTVICGLQWRGRVKSMKHLKKKVYFCCLEPKLFLQHVYLLMGVDAKTVEIEPLTQGLMDLIDPA